ncbi:MAG: hypothetical protein Q9224_003811 [Gallowayella concinna]
MVKLSHQFRIKTREKFLDHSQTSPQTHHANSTPSDPAYKTLVLFILLRKPNRIFPHFNQNINRPRKTCLEASPIMLSELQDLVAFAAEPEVVRHFGFLKELGLDFGWGPTAFVEWVVEHVHVYAGTPWWASIIIAMLAIRLTIFKTYIGSADVSARMLMIKPQMQEIRQRMDDAKTTQDVAAVMKESQAMKSLYKAAGIQIWKSALPLLNVPLGYGFFRLSREMAALPVPGLESGGLLWFTDLTLSDPTFLLPLGTGTLTFFMFKVGNRTTQTPSVSALKGVMVPPSAPRVNEEAEIAQGGVFGNAKSKMKSTMSDVKKRAQKVYMQDNNEGERSGGRRSEKDLKEAKRYDEKRRKEIEQGMIHKSQHPRR